MRNIDIVKLIVDTLGKGEITFVTDRKGHDLRYAIDAGKIEKELGWVLSALERSRKRSRNKPKTLSSRHRTSLTR